MSDSGLFAAWTIALDLPAPFDTIVKDNGNKRMSVSEQYCSHYNTNLQGKTSTLHSPTLFAIIRLINIMNGNTAGAMGIQVNSSNKINYYCLEYILDDEEGGVTVHTSLFCKVFTGL